MKLWSKIKRLFGFHDLYVISPPADRLIWCPECGELVEDIVLCNSPPEARVHPCGCLLSRDSTTKLLRGSAS